MSKENTSNQDIFSKGCLIQLTFSAWGAQKKIPRAKIQEAMGSKAAKGSKDLFKETKELKAIDSNRKSAKSYIKSMSTPFPLDNMYLIAYSLVEEMDRKLTYFQEEDERLCFAFYAKYPELILSAEEYLGPLYNVNDYPSARDIERRFSFSWSFVVVGAPGESSLLDPALVKREEERYFQMINEAKEVGVRAIRMEFKGIVDTAIDKLTPGANGEVKKFQKNTMQGKFMNFFESFSNRNIFEDNELQKVLDKAKGIVGDMDVEMLKLDIKMQREVKEQMSSVAELMASCIGDAPERSIKID